MARNPSVQLVIEGQNNATAAINQVSKQLDDVGKKARQIGADIGAAFSLGAVAGFARETTQAAAELQRVADAAGVSAERMQELQIGARRFGVDSDKLSDILKDTRDRIGDFAENGGGEMSDFFENIAGPLGVTIDQFRNLSGEEALGLYIQTLQQANVDQDAMTFYLEALASDASLLYPLLSNNADQLNRFAQEARNAGRITSNETVKGLADAELRLKDFDDEIQNVKNEVTVSMIPVFTQFVRSLGDVTDKSSLMNAAITAVTETLRYMGLGLRTILGFLEAVATYFAGTLAAAVVLFTNGWDAAVETWKTGAADARKSLVRMADDLQKIIDSEKIAAREAKARAAEQKRLADEKAKLAATEVDNNRKVVVSTKELTAAYKAISPAIEAQLDAAKKSQTKANSDLSKALSDREQIIKSFDERIAKLGQAETEATEPRFSQVTDLQALAQQQLAAGDTQKAIESASSALDKLQELEDAGENAYGFKGIGEQLKEIALQANTIEQTKAKDVLKKVGEEVQRLEALKDFEITPRMNEQAYRKIYKQLSDLYLLSSGQSFVNYELIQAAPEAVGFYSGGYTGAGNPSDVAGLAHKDEYVINSPLLSAIGGPGAAESMISAYLNGAFDTGLSGISSAFSDASAPEYMGIADLRTNSGTVRLVGTQQSLSELLVAAKKRGT